MKAPDVGVTVEDLDTPEKMLAFAVESHRIARSMYVLCVPWRYREWNRRRRLVKARVAISKAARARFFGDAA